MSAAAPELPAIEDQTTFNLARWEEVCADPEVAKLEFRIETDAYGTVLMTPPPSFDHSDAQGILIELLLKHGPNDGRARPEVPISTSAGVRAIDVAWISEKRLADSLSRKVLTVAPEICIEVLSPSNTQSEIDEKKRLHFEAGAEEVWICGLDGTLRVFVKETPDETSPSPLCPELPERIELN